MSADIITYKNDDHEEFYGYYSIVGRKLYPVTRGYLEEAGESDNGIAV